ncbi:MAG: TIGR02466 family protein [Pseudomonadota bacterium]
MSAIRTLFPTTILHAEAALATQIDALEEACWMIEEGDAAGQDWCEAEGYPGYTSYASLNDLPARHPEFADLQASLDQAAQDFATALHWDLGTARLHCDSLWVNILGEGGGHSGHLHPNSVISGTAYVTMPEGAGRLKLEDPRLPMMMAAPPLKPDAPAKRFEYIQPKQGDIIMWESWLRHEVMPSQSEEARISISFNYALIDSSTSYAHDPDIDAD